MQDQNLINKRGERENFYEWSITASHMLFQGRNHTLIAQIIRIWRIKQPQPIQLKRVPNTEGYFKGKRQNEAS